jgi:hypothetical protein
MEPARQKRRVSTEPEKRLQRTQIMRHRERIGRGLDTGRAAAHFGVSAVADITGHSRRYVRYWHRKTVDPNIHSGQWGGARQVALGAPAVFVWF